MTNRRHYFSIESILATEEQLSCTFLKDDSKLGFLDPGCKSENMNAGSKLLLPFWITSCLSHSRSVVVELPSVYKRGFRDVLKADPSVVDLKSLARFFYIMGQNLIKTKHKESNEIKEILTQTFRKRFRMIMLLAVYGNNEPPKKLDWTEVKIYEAAKQSHEILILRITKEDNLMKASPMITSHKKRKITEIDLI